uniref:m7GpppX diphosphatase n=1 Tax=Lynceus sp. MCZ IZ 141354 TaxID=1930659 RepID=A0A9N6ZFJ5_9CRUS|nr:EOG090X06NK [Lynceus sp. MCZ IZ 141354]
MESINGSDNPDTTSSEQFQPAQLTISRVLNETPESKYIALECSDKFSHKAVVTLSQLHLQLKDAAEILKTTDNVTHDFTNDIYKQYRVQFTNDVKVNVIHPATEKHILKYSAKKLHIFRETPEMYKKIVEKHVNENYMDLEWVYNILDHKSESDRIVLEKEHFIMLPDMKWDGNVSSLYLMCLIKQRGIKSIRDLRSSHIPMLESVQQEAGEAIKAKYGLPCSQLRFYFHYHPTYFHLHVHVTKLDYFPPGCSTEKAHLLDNVINNLRISDNYYEIATLPVVTHEDDSLYQILKNQNLI